MMELRRQALHEGIEELNQEAELFALRVAPLYASLGWAWTGSPMPPNAEEILKTLEELFEMLRSAVDEGKLDEQDHWYCATGGLEVRYEGRGQFLMSFSLEEWVEMSVLLFELRETDV